MSKILITFIGIYDPIALIKENKGDNKADELQKIKKLFDEFEKSKNVSDLKLSYGSVKTLIKKHEYEHVYYYVEPSMFNVIKHDKFLKIMEIEHNSTMKEILNEEVKNNPISSLWSEICYDWIEEVYNKHKDDEIHINVSSGMPSMKNGIKIALYDFNKKIKANIKAYEVTLKNGGISDDQTYNEVKKIESNNKTSKEINKIEPKIDLEFLKTNINKCKSPDGPKEIINVEKRVKRIIDEMNAALNINDYRLVYNLYKLYNPILKLDSKIFGTLKIMADLSEIIVSETDYGFDSEFVFFDFANDIEAKKIYYYYLHIINLSKKSKMLEYCQGLSPLFIHIVNYVMEEKFNVKYNEFYIENKKENRKNFINSISKFNLTIDDFKSDNDVNSKSDTEIFDYYLGSSPALHISAKLLECLNQKDNKINNNFIENIKKLLSVENALRQKYMHGISKCTITEVNKDLKKECNLQLSDVNTIIEKCFKYALGKYELDLELYETFNLYLMNKINK